MADLNRYRELVSFPSRALVSDPSPMASETGCGDARPLRIVRLVASGRPQKELWAVRGIELYRHLRELPIRRPAPFENKGGLPFPENQITLLKLGSLGRLFIQTDLELGRKRHPIELCLRVAKKAASRAQTVLLF